MDWKASAADSPYRTAVAVEAVLRRGDRDDARVGLQELIDALSRSDKRAIKSQAIRLMTHVIKWQAQPSHRSRSWAATIEDARAEIADIQEETPTLTRTAIEAMWERCFQAARRDAEAELNQEIHLAALSWADVFERTYRFHPESREDVPHA
jgi:hypothetical protein